MINSTDGRHHGRGWNFKAGGRSTEDRSHKRPGELTDRTPPGESQINLSYDDTGNLTQEGSSDGDYKYTYDFKNRIVEVQENQSGTWNTVAEYDYDAKGRRIVKTVSNSGNLNGTTRYLWGGQSDWQCLEELDGSDNIEARYTYAPGYIDAVACQERDLDDDGDLSVSDEMVYYHSTTLHSVYALINSSETVVERYKYDAYGKVTVLEPDWSADGDNASDVHNPYLYTGRRNDAETNLYQYRHRYYSWRLGRFISRDPKGYVDGWNLYLYADGNPTGSLDAFGLLACPKNECNIFKFKLDWVVTVVVKGGGVFAKATVRAGPGPCCMEDYEEKLYFKGPGIGVGIGEVGVGGKTDFRWAMPRGGECVSWSDWDNSFGRITLAGAHIGYGFGLMWVTPPYGKKQGYITWKGVGVGMATSVGQWGLNPVGVPR